jgi:hypothetical protein
MLRPKEKLCFHLAMPKQYNLLSKEDTYLALIDSKEYQGYLKLMTKEQFMASRVFNFMLSFLHDPVVCDVIQQFGINVCDIA